MLVILISLCLIVTGCVVIVSIHGWWQYALGWLLFLICFTTALKIIKWMLPKLDSIFEEGEAAGKE